MPEFAKFQQNAKELSMRLTRHFMNHQGCVGFFTALIPNNQAIDEALIIDSLACSLDSENDQELQFYYRSLNKEANTATQENENFGFEQFKIKILTGMYLMKWSKYNNTVSSYINKPLIELFKQDLDTPSLEVFDKELFTASLTALSQYCSFVYEKQHNKKVYEHLNRQLGNSIQVDIYAVRNSRLSTDSSWYGLYTGVMQSIGMNMS